MEVISTNLAQPKTFLWNGRKVTTGIYKIPTDDPIYLDNEEVRGDEVSDRKVHGGTFKACYLFSVNQYPYWKNLYPHLDWTYGMLGENLTVNNLNEKKLIIGSIYQLGKAKVQITIPREPCFKFAYKFGTSDVLKQFIEHGYSGAYVRVIDKGEVKVGDTLNLISQVENSISIFELFKVLYNSNKNRDHILRALSNDAIPEKLKKRLRSF